MQNLEIDQSVYGRSQAWRIPYTSYMGAIGFIMGGSGLSELWSIMYAANSIGKMLTGHSFARSLRAHFLTQLGLGVHFMQNLEIDQITSANLQALHTAALDNVQAIEDFPNIPTIMTTMEKLQTFMKEAASSNRSTKL